MAEYILKLTDTTDDNGDPACELDISGDMDAILQAAGVMALTIVGLFNNGTLAGMAGEKYKELLAAEQEEKNEEAGE